MERRRYHHRDKRPGWLRAQLPYILVLSGVAAGLVLVALNHFKRGSVLLAAAALGGALARLVLEDVGLLAGRRRSTDVTIMVAFAIGIAVVAWVVPGKAQ